MKNPDDFLNQIADRLDDAGQVLGLNPSEQNLARAACILLQAARDCLVQANAPRATDRVRHALKSAEGAVRAASCRAYSAEVTDGHH